MSTRFHIDKSKPFMIVQDSNDSFRAHIDWMTAQNLPIEIWDHPASALREVAIEPRAWAQIMIRIDSFGMDSDIGPRIIAFREHTPSVPIVATSTMTARHFFALENLAMYDVLLREPFDAESLEFALAVAPINNEVWKRRHAIEMASRHASRSDNVVLMSRRPIRRPARTTWLQEKPNSFA